VVTNAEVASINVEGGRATGVTLSDGRTVRAERFVASSVPASITMLEMVGCEHLDSGLADELGAYAWNSEAIFGAHYALSRPPRFRAEATNPDVPRALNLIIGYESSDDLQQHMEDLRARRLSPVGSVHASIPTLNDPTQAPPGYHTAFGWHFVPSAVDTEFAAWDKPATQERLKAVSGAYTHYAPDFEDCVLAATTHTPVDTVRRVPSMRFGDRHHGSYHPDNWESFRPHPQLASYRTPIDGLYLCGASQHPGGSFHGQPGYNAASVILSDIGESPWWNPPQAREVLRRLD
jgi:phytoene dehydrogenase-like protein